MMLEELEDGHHVLALSQDEVTDAVREYAWARLKVHPLRPKNSTITEVQPVMASLVDEDFFCGYSVTLRVRH